MNSPCYFSLSRQGRGFESRRPRHSFQKRLMSGAQREYEHRLALKTASGLGSNFKVQRRESKPILVLSVDVSDGGISLLQLSLAQFDDRT
jgi:hypothetical protein